MHSDNVIEFRRLLDQDNSLHNEVMQIQTDNGCVAVTEIVRLAEKYDCPVSIEDFFNEPEELSPAMTKPDLKQQLRMFNYIIDG